MKIFRVLIVALVLMSVLVAAVPSVRAQDSASCTTQSLSYEVVLQWTLEYLHVEITTGTPVVRVFGFTVVEGETSLVNFEIEYISASGETVIASGSFALTDTCTPDFAAATSGWECSVASSTASYETVLAEGNVTIVILTYEEWYDWALDIGIIQIGTHYETWELTALYYEYLLTLGVDLTTFTTTCYLPWQPGPVTLHNAGNGSLREEFPVRAYFVNAAEHPDLDALLRSDPHNAVNNSAYLGELMYEGTVDVIGGGDAYVVLAPHSLAAGYNVLVVVCGVEAPGQCEFAAYWSVSDADANGEVEGELITYASSYFNGAAWYTHSADQPANFGN